MKKRIHVEHLSIDVRINSIKIVLTPQEWENVDWINLAHAKNKRCACKQSNRFLVSV